MCWRTPQKPTRPSPVAVLRACNEPVGLTRVVTHTLRRPPARVNAAGGARPSHSRDRPQRLRRDHVRRAWHHLVVRKRQRGVDVVLRQPRSHPFMVLGNFGTVGARPQLVPVDDNYVPFTCRQQRLELLEKIMRRKRLQRRSVVATHSGRTSWSRAKRRNSVRYPQSKWLVDGPTMTGLGCAVGPIYTRSKTKLRVRETGVSFEGTTARTIGYCLERFSHKRRQLLS